MFKNDKITLPAKPLPHHLDDFLRPAPEPAKSADSALRALASPGNGGGLDGLGGGRLL